MATALLFASAAGVVLNGPAPRLVKQALSPIVEGAWSQAAAVRASAAIAPMVLATGASAEFNFQVEMNRPPIELDPFTVTPFGWAVLAVYLTWFSWTILRPPSEEETKVWERRAEEAAEQAAGAAVFLKAASEEEGATQTASGLVIKQLTPGSGSAPTLDDTVVVHYTGKLSNGSIFDSSYKRDKPAEFKLNQVIRGWGEGLQLMKPGAKALLTIPAELAYGAVGAPPSIPGNAALQFEVELLEIKTTQGFKLPF